MAKKKECLRCKGFIYIEKEKYVQLKTVNAGKVMDDSYFHFQCFREWHEQKVNEKAMNKINVTAGALMGKIKEIQQTNVR